MVQHTDTHMGEARVLAHTRMGQPVRVYGQHIYAYGSPICIWAANTRMHGLPIHVWAEYLYGTEHSQPINDQA